MAKRPTGNQKKYRNVGVAELVFEDVPIEPGAEFRATLTPEHESQLIAGGHIEVIEDQSIQADRAQAEAAVEGNGPSGVIVEESRPNRRRS